MEDRYNLGNVKTLEFEKEEKIKKVDKDELDRIIKDSNIEKMEEDLRNVNITDNNRGVINFSRVLSVVMVILTAFIIIILLYGIIGSLKYTGGLIGNLINM